MRHDTNGGRLYLVPTPIGNLEDMTLRAIRILREADGILSEDTRTTGLLLRHLEITNKLSAFHQHNEHAVLSGVIKRLESGEKLALVSDAGTPGISDPGFLLVRACIRMGIPVECLPGPTAFVPALVTSGLPSDRFVFEGFLPPKKGRQTRLKHIAGEERTVILYESPHRILKTLEQLMEHLDHERPVAAIREISKIYEENIRGSLAEVFAHFKMHEPRGEFVLIIGGNPES
jgi:16S rRNA (cytidine1402-2'-O)-methyltransferase